MLPTCNRHHYCAASVARAENEMLDALKRGPALEALIMNRGRTERACQDDIHAVACPPSPCWI